MRQFSFLMVFPYYPVQPHLPSMIVSELDGVSDFCVVSTKNTKITAFLDFKI